VATLEARAYLLMLTEHDATAECESTGCRDCELLREVLDLVAWRMAEPSARQKLPLKVVSRETSEIG
jgi:hypothetical protein